MVAGASRLVGALQLLLLALGMSLGQR